MNEIDYVSEEDIRILVEETIDYTIEDQGIGHYEYGDGNYIDKNPQISLTDGEIMVQYTDDVEQVIFTRVIGSITGYDADDFDYECDYMVELISCEWNKENKYWEATYGVTQL